jgi:predicted phage terminase large subunit-like protein
LLKAIRIELESRKSEADRAKERQELLSSHLAFTRRFFIEKEGQPFSVAPFHPVMCDTLDKVFSGEIKRLIINIPPGYGKTALGVINFIAHGFAINPRSRFIHASYAQALALDNSSHAKDIINLEGYQAHWPIQLRMDTNAKGLWRTTAGGHLRAASSGEPITGFRAGILAEPGFTGCFPAGTKVWTERGLVAIDEIVRARMPVNVWAHDNRGNMVLRPLTDWHRNPANDIVRVSFNDGSSVDCTADHRFWTSNRGWVRADSLCEDDVLPAVHGSEQRLDNVGIDAEPVSGRLDTVAVFPSGSIGPVIKGDISLAACENASVVGFKTSLRDNGSSASDGLPCVSTPDLVNDCSGNAVTSRHVLSALSHCGVDRERVSVAQNGAGVDFSLAERPMSLGIQDVVDPAAIPQISQSIVGDVPVIMAGVGTNWSWPNEGQQHELVNSANVDLAISREAYPSVPVCVLAGAEYDAIGNVNLSLAGSNDPGLATDESEIADGVKPFISGYRKPVSVVYVGHAESTFCLTVKEYHNFTVEQGVIVKNCLIIDDPLKPDDAHSETMRKFINARWENTFRSRLAHEDVPVIVIMQRLHVDDFVAHLLEKSGERWHLLQLPILIEGEPQKPDGNVDLIPHGLPDGPLWMAKHNRPQIEILKLAPQVFAGQYMQTPIISGGDMFKLDWLREYETAPPLSTLKVYMGSDYAVTSDGGDYTVHVVVGIDPEGYMWLLDLWRKQASSDVWVEAWCDLVKQYRPSQAAEESGQIKGGVGPFLTKRARERGASTWRRTFPTRGDKAIRAQSIRGRMAMQGLLVPKNAEWLADFKSELAAFPGGKHDDQVDALGLVGQLLDLISSGKHPEMDAPAKHANTFEAKPDGTITSNLDVKQAIEAMIRKRRARERR